ncbi:heme-binding protein soul3 [Neoarius graeffei]|uniref:heme-binding protein soul3 n=1 Tax=Neoarius graeffei TaxID=443677 RepID=UPI00298C8F65|nr:heme-binding protein soul3 [Neoarius graeffei]
MDSCGGGRGQGSRPQHGMITLEDLESFSGDQLSDSGSGSAEEETEEEEEEDRLLAYWQEVARGHRVEVPRDMAEPIHQLTTNNNGTHQRETVPFTLLSCKKKCGDVVYEKHYDKAHWACITIKEDTYEQSICYGFMKIMKYICQQNSLGIYLGMTIPILTVVHTEEANTRLSRAITIAYHLPSNHQTLPPQPLDPDVVIETWPDMTVYSRAFTGDTNETTLMTQRNALAEILDSPGLYVTSSFIIAAYSNPASAHRVNEIWFIQRQ